MQLLRVAFTLISVQLALASLQIHATAISAFPIPTHLWSTPQFPPTALIYQTSLEQTVIPANAWAGSYPTLQKENRVLPTMVWFSADPRRATKTPLNAYLTCISTTANPARAWTRHAKSHFRTVAIASIHAIKHGSSVFAF